MMGKRHSGYGGPVLRLTCRTIGVFLCAWPSPSGDRTSRGRSPPALFPAVMAAASQAPMMAAPSARPRRRHHGPFGRYPHGPRDRHEGSPAGDRDRPHGRGLVPAERLPGTARRVVCRTRRWRSTSEAVSPPTTSSRLPRRVAASVAGARRLINMIEVCRIRGTDAGRLRPGPASRRTHRD